MEAESCDETGVVTTAHNVVRFEQRIVGINEHVEVWLAAHHALRVVAKDSRTPRSPPFAPERHELT